MKHVLIVAATLLLFSAASCQTATPTTKQPNKPVTAMDSNYNKTDEEWKKTLTDEQYYVLRQKGTEAPYTGQYTMNFEKGIYKCAGCGYELFTSDQKFESHCGWPSFDNEIGGGERVKKIRDMSHGMIRTEIICARCGGHLGHIFDDGPTKTGQRYCVNSLSINFIPEKETGKK